MATHHPSGLFVVVPFYNEARGIGQTLDALIQQEDRDFQLVMVDNASTDDGALLVSRFIAAHPELPIDLIDEPLKGTGVAADTGFRHAIQMGARWIARTDADCVPASDWTRRLRSALDGEGLEFVAGRILPRTDEEPLTPLRHAVLRLMIWIAENYGRIHRRGSRFLYPYFMAAGNNLAISACLYQRCGGFPRISLEAGNEDRALSEAVRTLTCRAALKREVIVYNSTRRVRAYGVINTLRWYRNRGYQPHPDEVDVR